MSILISQQQQLIPAIEAIKTPTSQDNFKTRRYHHYAISYQNSTVSRHERCSHLRHALIPTSHPAAPTGRLPSPAHYGDHTKAQLLFQLLLERR